jgi:hypothetical protein
MIDRWRDAGLRTRHACGRASRFPRKNSESLFHWKYFHWKFPGKLEMEIFPLFPLEKVEKWKQLEIFPLLSGVPV